MGKPRLRLEYVQAETLAKNPNNWRRHPDGQLAGLREVIDDPDIGWAGALLYNERTQRLVDGHGRLEITGPEEYVPVLVGDWSEEAEKKILLTLDPISALASADVQQLTKLLEEVDLDTPGLAAVEESLTKLLGDDKPVDDGASVPEGVAPGDSRYMIVVTCRDESHQAGLLEQFMEQGLKVKALVG